jgi:putative membrane protein
MRRTGGAAWCIHLCGAARRPPWRRGHTLYDAKTPDEAVMAPLPTSPGAAPKTASTAADVDATRRTWLAAERTWLAWWRTALGTTVAAIGVGSVLPQALDVSRLAFAALGVGYAALAVGLFWAGWARQRHVGEALSGGGFASLDRRLVGVFTASGAILAVATGVLIVVQA